MVSHDEYASILHGVVCSSDGRPIHDQPLWAEQQGLVIVAVDGRGRIAVLEHHRPAPIAEAPGWRADVKLAEHGRISLEFPRGLAKAGETALDGAVREAEEETGLAARDPELIGEANQNTAYYLFNTAIVRVKLGGGTPRHRLDTSEPIRRPRGEDGLFKTPAEIAALIASGQIICGLTKAAFVTHLAPQLESMLR